MDIFNFTFKVLVQLRSGLLEEVIKTLEAAMDVDTPPFVKKIEFSEQVVSIHNEQNQASMSSQMCAGWGCRPGGCKESLRGGLGCLTKLRFSVTELQVSEYILLKLLCF